MLNFHFCGVDVADISGNNDRKVMIYDGVVPIFSATIKMGDDWKRSDNYNMTFDSFGRIKEKKVEHGKFAIEDGYGGYFNITQEEAEEFLNYWADKALDVYLRNEVDYPSDEEIEEMEKEGLL